MCSGFWAIRNQELRSPIFWKEIPIFRKEIPIFRKKKKLATPFPPSPCFVLFNQWRGPDNNSNRVIRSDASCKNLLKRESYNPARIIPHSHRHRLPSPPISSPALPVLETSNNYNSVIQSCEAPPRNEKEQRTGREDEEGGTIGRKQETKSKRRGRPGGGGGGWK